MPPCIGRFLFDACTVPQRRFVDRITSPARACLVLTRADGQNHAGRVSGADDDVLCPGRAMKEIPLSQRPLLALDDEKRLAGQHEKVLLVGFPVVHPHRRTGPSTRRKMPICGNSVLALEFAARRLAPRDATSTPRERSGRTSPPRQARARSRSAREAPREPPSDHKARVRNDTFEGCSVITPDPEEGTMTDEHPITCIAISAAIALKLLAGTANAAPHGVDLFNQASGSTGRPIIVTDLSNPTRRCSSAGAWTSPGSTARSSTAR